MTAEKKSKTISEEEIKTILKTIYIFNYNADLWQARWIMIEPERMDEIVAAITEWVNEQ